MQLRTARIFVNDLARARVFYSQTLDLPLTADGSVFGYFVFAAGSTDLVVESVPADAPPEDAALVGRFTGLSFTVPDLIQKHRDLTALGVHFTGLPERQAWGGTLATFEDPSGNQLQLVQPPPSA